MIRAAVGVDGQDVGHGTVERRLNADLLAELDDTPDSERTAAIPDSTSQRLDHSIGDDSVVVSDCQQWQLESDAPELYQRYLVPAMTAMWATDLAERAALRHGERALDVACGTGVVARIAAERVGAAGRVAALDINRGMLAVAVSCPAARGARIEWHEGSVLALPFPEDAFDAVLCQLGLQFFPDRPLALREMRRVLSREGRLALNVFGAIEHNPATQALANALDRRLGASASLAKRTEHALADTEELRGLLTAAGFQPVVISTARKTVRFPSVSDYVQIQLAATPLAHLASRPEGRRFDRLLEVLTEDIAKALAISPREEPFTFPQEVHIALATG